MRTKLYLLIVIRTTADKLCENGSSTNQQNQCLLKQNLLLDPFACHERQMLKIQEKNLTILQN